MADRLSGQRVIIHSGVGGDKAEIKIDQKPKKLIKVIYQMLYFENHNLTQSKLHSTYVVTSLSQLLPESKCPANNKFLSHLFATVVKLQYSRIG